MNRLFVTGIGTDIGKTVVAAILVEALAADYWKPVQSGNLEYTDSDFIREYTSHHTCIHPEDFLLTNPVSPHLAAEFDGKPIDLQNFNLPILRNNLIIEGAGGLMVPLNENNLIIDLIISLQVSVIVVVKNYLGSINHTLLTIEVLKQKNIPILGIIFNGEGNLASESYIEAYTQIPILAKIPKVETISKGFIIQESDKLRKRLVDHLPNSTNL